MNERISITMEHLDFIISKYLRAEYFGINLADIPQAQDIFKEVKKRILQEVLYDGHITLESCSLNPKKTVKGK